MPSGAHHCPSPEENTNKNNNQTQPEETDKHDEKQNYDAQHHHHHDHYFVHGESKSITHMPINGHEAQTTEVKSEATPADCIDKTNSERCDKVQVCKKNSSGDGDDEGDGERVTTDSSSKDDSVGNVCSEAMARNGKMLHTGHTLSEVMQTKTVPKNDSFSNLKVGYSGEVISKNGNMQNGYYETNSKTDNVELGFGQNRSKNNNLQNGYGETACKTENMESERVKTRSQNGNLKKASYGEATTKCDNLGSDYGCYSATGLTVEKFKHQVDEKDTPSCSFLNMSNDTLRPGIIKCQSASNSLLASLMGLEDDFLRQEAEFARLFPQDVAAFEIHSTINGHAPTLVKAHRLSMSLSQAASSTPATTSVLASTGSPGSVVTASVNLHGSRNGFAELPCPKRQCNRKTHEVEPMPFHSKLSDVPPSSQLSSSTSIDNTDPNTQHNLLTLPHMQSSRSLSQSNFGTPMMTMKESLSTITSLPLNSNRGTTNLKEVHMLLSDSQFATPSIQMDSVEKSGVINPGSTPAGSQQISGHAFNAGMYSSTYNMAYNRERSNLTMPFLAPQTPNGTVETTATPHPKVASYGFLAQQACPTRSLVSESVSMQNVLPSSTRGSYPGLFLQLNNGSPDASDRVNVLASSSSGNSSEEGTPLYGSSSSILRFQTQKRIKNSQQESSKPCEETLTESFTIASYDDLPNNSVVCRTRAKRGCATHPRSIAERVRRTKISERMKKLQDLVPHIDKQANTAVMLDEIVEYIKHLQNKVQVLTEQQSMCNCQEQISSKQTND